MASHRINLRGPWDFTWQQDSADPADQPAVSKAGTATMPREWTALFGDVAGTAQFRRKFHRPTNLDPHERVLIVFTELRGTGNVRLNESPLGEFNADGGLVDFEITTAMKPFNELIVDVSFDPSRLRRSQAACLAWLHWKSAAIDDGHSVENRVALMYSRFN